MRNVVVSFSGGKDSTLALDLLLQDPAVRVDSLLVSVTDGYQRTSIHGVREALLDQQAQALGLPTRKVRLPTVCDNATYERLMGEAVARMVADGVDAVAFGDLFLEDIRAYRERMLAGTGLAALFPLWRMPTPGVAEAFFTAGYRSVVVCVDTKKLDASYLGREYDRDFVQSLPADVDPCGENGEFHTYVFAGPRFSQPVRFTLGQLKPSELGSYLYIDLVPAQALGKG